MSDVPCSPIANCKARALHLLLATQLCGECNMVVGAKVNGLVLSVNVIPDVLFKEHVILIHHIC